MAELKFPWELNIKRIQLGHYIYPNQAINKITFIHNGKTRNSIENFNKIKESKIKIVELELAPNWHSICLNFEAYESGPIPYIKNLINTTRLFMGSDFNEIPNDLFKHNPQLENFELCFSFCKFLKNIPKELFKYNLNTIDYSAIFTGCPNLTSIPCGLFPPNIYGVPQDLTECFTNCINIKEVPSELFAYVDRDHLNNAFDGCSNLEKINGNIFSNNIKHFNMSDFNKIFKNCPKLKKIPKEILMLMI